MPNITFLIGNGFDVNLGLETKFTDFYDDYLSSDIPDGKKCIENFRNAIRDDITDCEESDKDKKYEKWSDYEIAFGKHICGTIDDVCDISADFNVKFSEHLKREMSRCKYNNKIIPKKFKDFLILGYNRLEEKDKAVFDNYFNVLKSEQFKIKFINFNYTDTLDNLIKVTINDNNGSKVFLNAGNYVETVGEVLHIHGTVDDNIVIAVDSVSQIADEKVRENDQIVNFCTKKGINGYIGRPYIENQFQSIINESNIIYAYGLSFGETDSSRWKVINEWIKSKPFHRLIIYLYNTEFNKMPRTFLPSVIRTIENAKDKCLALLGFEESEYEKYRSQIFVIDSSKVLNFKLVEERVDVKEEIPTSEEKELVLSGK